LSTFVVTGATGFIGSNLVHDLVYKDRVVALVRDGEVPDSRHGNKIEVVRGELEDLRTCERLISEYRPDGVFHLAAQAMVGTAKRDPFNTLESNVRGTYNLLEAFRRHRKPEARFVMASSDKAYGELPVGSDAYDEDMPLEGRGPYDVSKSCADLIAQSYGMEYGLPIAIIRAGNVYGPGDREMSRIVPSLVADVVNYRPLTVRSDGTPIRDYINVRDVVRGYQQAYKRHQEGVRAFNLAARNPLTVHQMANEIVGAVKHLSHQRRSPYGDQYRSMCETFLSVTKGEIKILGERSGEIQKQVLDPTRANTELLWAAEIPLQEGLATTILWGFNNLKQL
jgi:CDP-glucose 4,6-dehydratase